MMRATLVVIAVLAAQADAAAQLRDELRMFQGIAGRWTGTSEAPRGTRSRHVELTFTERLSGHAITAEYVSTHDGKLLQQHLVFTYDAFRKEYRCAVIDNIYGLLDVYEG